MGGKKATSPPKIQQNIGTCGNTGSTEHNPPKTPTVEEIGNIVTPRYLKLYSYLRLFQGIVYFHISLFEDNWNGNRNENTGWSGGAMVLGKFPVPGRPTNVGYSRARAYCACSRCGWGLFGRFFSRLSFLFFLPLSGRRPDID